MADDAGPRPLVQILADQGDRVAGYLYALGADPPQVEDVVQEVALAAAASAEQPESPLAWLLVVARRRFQDALRRAKVRRRTEQPITELVEAVELAMAEPDPGADAGDGAEVAALRACLERLAPRAREAIDLRYWKGLGPDAIAASMGWSEAAVRVALSKARKAIETCVRRALRGGEDGDAT